MKKVFDSISAHACMRVLGYCALIGLLVGILGGLLDQPILLSIGVWMCAPLLLAGVAIVTAVVPLLLIKKLLG